MIEPAANDAPYKVEITIPTALTRRVRFVDPAGRPVAGRLSSGLTSSPDHQVILDGDEAEVLGLDPKRAPTGGSSAPTGACTSRRRFGLTPPNRSRSTMGQPAAVTGRLTDEQGKAVAGASASVRYLADDLPAIPRPRGPAVTDADGRFRVEGIFPGNAVRIEFFAPEKANGQGEHFRPELLRKLSSTMGRPRRGHRQGKVRAVVSIDRGDGGCAIAGGTPIYRRPDRQPLTG